MRINGHDEAKPTSRGTTFVTVSGEEIDARGYNALRVEFTMRCSDEPVLAAVIVRTKTSGCFARLHRHRAACEAHFSLTGSLPYGSVAGRATRRVALAQYGKLFTSPASIVVSAEDSPEDFIQFDAQSRLPLGSLSRLASLPAWGVTAEIYVVAKQDTARSHGRWSVRPEHASDLPSGYQFLLSGRTAGCFDL